MRIHTHSKNNNFDKNFLKIKKLTKGSFSIQVFNYVSSL